MILCNVIHKNEDAARKWCPFAWTRNNEGSKTMFERNTLDRENSIGEKTVYGSRCLTNGCMAWIDETDYVHDIAIGRCGLVNLSSR